MLSGATLGSSIIDVVLHQCQRLDRHPLLLGMGFLALSTTPVMLAMVQEQFPKNRAVANGVFMSIVFVLRPLGTLAIGALGDRYGLQTAFLWGALVSLLSLPAILLLPEYAGRRIEGNLIVPRGEESLMRTTIDSFIFVILRRGFYQRGCSTAATPAPDPADGGADRAS